MTRSHLLFSSKTLRTLVFGALIVLGQFFAGSAALAQARTTE